LNNIAIEIFLILVLILANGLLALTETAVISSRRTRLREMADRGDEAAERALALAENPGDFLSTVQIGITLVGILAGAFGGAKLAKGLAPLFAMIPGLAPYSENIAFTVVVILITYFTLILGELTPKRLALNNPEGVARVMAGPMNVLSKIVRPLVRFLTISTAAVMRLLRIQGEQQPAVTEEEIKILVDQGRQAGIFEEAEQEMVLGVFRFGDRRVGTLMTPRPDIVWLDVADPPEVNQRKIVESVHARFPVARDDLDDVLGVVLAKNLLVKSLDGQGFNLEGVLDAPLFVPESTLALRMMERFRDSGQQMALIIDEYGSVQGLVTLHDVLEAIVGDFPPSGSEAEPEIVRRDDGSWLVDGLLPVDEFKEIFRLDRLPNEDRGYYQTVSGFVMETLGRIPKAGDHFDWSGLRIEVIDMDGFRVDKVMVIPAATDTGEQ